MYSDGIKLGKNVPQSYIDYMYGNVTDQEDLYGLGLWLQDNDETIME